MSKIVGEVGTRLKQQVQARVQGLEQPNVTPSARALSQALDRVQRTTPAAEEALPALKPELRELASDSVAVLAAAVRTAILTPGATIADLGPTDPASIVPVACPLPGYGGVTVHFRTDALAVVAFCTLNDADAEEASLMSGCRALALLMPRIERWGSRMRERAGYHGKQTTNKHSKSKRAARPAPTPADDLTADNLKGYIPVLTDEVFLKWATTRGYPLAIETQPDAFYSLYGTE